MSEHKAHREFLNSYYGKVKHIYDLTRKYYLFGRDTALEKLLSSEWKTLVEIGPGTGRNLSYLKKRRPKAVLGGVDASDEMLVLARKKYPWAKLTHGFAESCKIEDVHGEKPDRILFSYCLSMVQNKDEAILNARKSLSPNGELWVVDFGDFNKMPGFVSRKLRKFLEEFHVSPLTEELILKHKGKAEWGPGHYFVIARLRPLSE